MAVGAVSDSISSKSSRVISFPNPPVSHILPFCYPIPFAPYFQFSKAVGPFYPLYIGRRDSTVQTFWMHCIYASVMCKIAPNVGRNQVVHNKDVQVQFMVTKWPGEGNGLHKSNRNRENGYGLNGQHNPWTGRSWTGRNERERKNEW